MSISEQFVIMVNGEFDEKVEQIVQDLQNYCPKKTGATARSFKVMSKSGGDGSTGLAKSAIVGSELLTAWFANYGNAQHYSYFGGKGHPGMPNYSGSGAKGLYYDGEFHLSSRTYQGSKYVEKVVAKWGG